MVIVINYSWLFPNEPRAEILERRIAPSPLNLIERETMLNAIQRLSGREDE